MLLALLLAAILFAAIGGVAGQVGDTREHVSETNDLNRQARFAMDQMVRTVSRSRLLLLPYPDNPNTNWPEHIREQTVPSSLPVGSSTQATAVLAVTLPTFVDLDGDGFPDADDDKDGRIDEDLYNDINNDFAPGIYLIDDDGDGWIDENGAWWWDDDEDFGMIDEDPIDGIDNDGDNNIDEDPSSDKNGDGCPGVCGVDDDGDGLVDEGNAEDDDEDGRDVDDWYNALVFYLDDGTLLQRTPVPWDEDGDAWVTGRDFIVAPLAENVTRFRVERLPLAATGVQMVDLTLELTSPGSGQIVSLNTRIRIGGAL